MDGFNDGDLHQDMNKFGGSGINPPANNLLDYPGGSGSPPTASAKQGVSPSSYREPEAGGDSSATGDIFQKLSAILDTKTSTSATSPTASSSAGSGSLLSPDSSVFYPTNTPSKGLSSILGLNQQQHRAGDNHQVAPGQHQQQQQHHKSSVRTLQCGEFKFPDATSPLNKVLTNKPNNNPPQSASFGFIGQTSDFQPAAGAPPGYASGAQSGPAGTGAPRKSDSSAEDDEDAGYGTSFGSSNAAGATQHVSTAKNVDDMEFHDLLKSLSNNNIARTSPPYSANPYTLQKTTAATGARQFNRLNGSGSPGMMYNEPQPPQFTTTDPGVAAQQALKILQQQAAVIQNCYLSYVNNSQHQYQSSGAAPPMRPANHNNNCSRRGGGFEDQFELTASPLENQAKMYRKGTSIYDASCTWSGQLPQRNLKTSVLSPKVFLGGVPWDVTETILVQTFRDFGQIRVEWPGKENHIANREGHNQNISVVPKGYLYVIFEDASQVEDLLSACSPTQEFNNAMGDPSCAHNTWYFKLSSRRMRNKEVQVIPWCVQDSNFVKVQTRVLDSQKTVFVGALHGMLTAEGLCKIFDDLFGGVVYAGIDTDKWKYPIGSGRVTFDNPRSYMKAVTAAFIEIKTARFAKKVQVDPYLEDALCSSCGLRQGPYFCREVACFKYFCRGCWENAHPADSQNQHHKPLMRNSKSHHHHHHHSMNKQHHLEC